eukprot:943593-Alexandrium_andersonii.AAC.1
MSLAYDWRSDRRGFCHILQHVAPHWRFDRLHASLRGPVKTAVRPLNICHIGSHLCLCSPPRLEFFPRQPGPRLAASGWTTSSQRSLPG